MSTLIINEKNLIDANCFDKREIIDQIKHALLLFNKGAIIFPDKTSQIFDEKSQNRINCMPATLLDQNICGVKWVSVFPENPKQNNQKNVSATILLSETLNGRLIAMMDGNFCTLVRTAGISGLAARYLARDDSETVGIVGAGEQAKMHLLMLKEARPSLKKCKVVSRTEKSEHDFKLRMERLLPDVEIVTTQGNIKAAVEDSDIIVTATSAQAPLVKAEWIKKGAFYSHVAGWEDEYDVAFKAGKIVCDDWHATKQRTQTISRMYHEGKLRDEAIYADLHEIVSGSKVGRENDNEFIYFNTVGLSYLDVHLSYEFYKQIRDKGSYKSVNFHVEDFWSVLKEKGSVN